MIIINDIEKTYGIKKVFSIDRLVLNKEDRIGLIGDNGSGKTTLMNIIEGRDKDYKGSIDIQNMKVERVDWSEDGARLESLSKLRSKKKDRNFSPGEWYDLLLSSYLDKDNSFLLMDEPTSHLDRTAKDKLLKKLNDRENGFLLVSHDRDFIKKTCNRILEIEEGKIYYYKGDYKLYLEEKEKNKNFQKKEYEKYISEKKRLSGVMEGLDRKKSSIRTTPKRFGNSEARLHKMGGQGNKKKIDKQIKSMESRIDHLEVKEKPLEKTDIRIEIPEDRKIYARTLIEGKNINKSYGDKIIFNKANFTMEKGDKIALLGPNGSGKTTLINMILNQENIKSHENLNIGYFSQLLDSLDLEKNVLENVLEANVYDETLARIILDRLGLTRDYVNKNIKNLSDGERSKVKLTKLLVSGFNLLVLDEPTNFFDMSTIEALEELLSNYEGNILFVSHDRYFIDNIANKLLIIEDKKIKTFKGSLNDYENPSSINEDELIVDYKIASINSRLSMEISKEERDRLELEYKKLIERKRLIK